MDVTVTDVEQQAAANLTAVGIEVDLVKHLIALALAEDLDGGVDVTTVATVPADAAQRHPPDGAASGR